MKPNERLSPEEQTQYILLENNNKNYEAVYGWKVGTILKRISIWYGNNGCGPRDLKQAYFVPADSDYSYGHIAWSDHVKELSGQTDIFDFI
jgi:hypothetical protein